MRRSQTRGLGETREEVERGTKFYDLMFLYNYPGGRDTSGHQGSSIKKRVEKHKSQRRPNVVGRCLRYRRHSVEGR